MQDPTFMPRPLSATEHDGQTVIMSDEPIFTELALTLGAPNLRADEDRLRAAMRWGAR